MMKAPAALSSLAMALVLGMARQGYVLSGWTCSLSVRAVRYVPQLYSGRKGRPTLASLLT